jgi:long-subunit fatty acid transport protein
MSAKQKAATIEKQQQYINCFRNATTRTNATNHSDAVHTAVACNAAIHVPLRGIRTIGADMYHPTFSQPDIPHAGLGRDNSTNKKTKSAAAVMLHAIPKLGGKK